MTELTARHMLANLYQVEPGDAVCRHADCWRPQEHGGAHLNYLEYEAFLLREIDAEQEQSDRGAMLAEQNWSH